MPKTITFIILIMFCRISAALPEEITVSCNYSGIYHYFVFNNPALNKEDETLSGTFDLTFNNAKGITIIGYYWGIRPDNNLKRIKPVEGSIGLFELTEDRIAISKYTDIYKVDEYIDRKTGRYEYVDFWGADRSRRIKTSGDCSKSSLRPIPENKF